MKKHLTICIMLFFSALTLSLMASCAHHDLERPKEQVIPSTVQALEPATNEDLAFVEDLLVGKGLDRTRIHAMLHDPRVVIDTGFIIRNLYHTKPKGTISQPDAMYYSPRFISKGKAFIEKNRETFESIRSRYGISPEIITAILIMESKLGTYPEKYQAFHVYASLTLANDPDVLSGLKETHGKVYPGLYQEKTIGRALSKGRWALGELYNLVLLSDELQMDPLDIKGSVAGAMGPAQFIPSTFRSYGVDGDSDGKRDPLNMADAMASIAHFLKHSGWAEDGDDQKRCGALWIYNHSYVYVTTVMMIYRDLSEYCGT